MRVVCAACVCSSLCFSRSCLLMFLVSYSRVYVALCLLCCFSFVNPGFRSFSFLPVLFTVFFLHLCLRKQESTYTRRWGSKQQPSKKTWEKKRGKDENYAAGKHSKNKRTKIAGDWKEGGQKERKNEKLTPASMSRRHTDTTGTHTGSRDYTQTAKSESGRKKKERQRKTKKTKKWCRSLPAVAAGSPPLLPITLRRLLGAGRRPASFSFFF